MESARFTYRPDGYADLACPVVGECECELAPKAWALYHAAQEEEKRAAHDHNIIILATVLVAILALLVLGTLVG